MPYIAEGFEESAAKVIRDALSRQVNMVRNAVRVGKSSPSMWPQADVRKAGHELNGAISLAQSALGQMNQHMSSEDVVMVREVARRAIEFKYNAKSA